MMHCSVIIPHFNQVASLNRCLEGLSHQNSEGIIFEVIVVDNGSDHFNVQNVQIQNLQILEVKKPKNPYHCRNEGIRKSKGKMLAFLDAKCVPYENWLKEGLMALNNYDLLGGHYQVETNVKLSSKVFPLMYLNNAKNGQRGFGFSGGNLFVKREVFKQIGLFRTEAASGNDILFTTEAKNHGFSLGYGSGTKVTYPAKGFSTLKRDVKKYGKGAAMTGQKTFLSIIKYLLPMRIKTFEEALHFRNYKFTVLEKVQLWLYIWIAKAHFAQGLISGFFSIKKEKASSQNS